MINPAGVDPVAADRDYVRLLSEFTPLGPRQDEPEILDVRALSHLAPAQAPF